MTASLPTVGGNTGTWGTELNTWLLVAHNTDGTAKGGSLTPTAVKTASTYTAAAGDFVPVDTTSNSVTVTLPTAPADGTQVAVKHVIQGSTNTVTIACAGSDVFNKASGPTTGTLTLLNQALWLQYKTSGPIWYVLADDLPLTGLDGRYIKNTLTTNTGDLIYASSANTPARLAAGAAGTVLGTGPTYVLPPGFEFGYDQITTSSITVSSTTEATPTSLIACASHTFDGGLAVLEINFPSARASGTVNARLAFVLFEGASQGTMTTEIARICLGPQTYTNGNGGFSGVRGSYRFTPSAGAHFYTIAAYNSAGTDGSIFSGAGGATTDSPSWARFTKV